MSRIVEEVDFGTATLVPDRDRADGWLVLLDGTQQSYVDTSDPTYLEFEYMRRLASLVDAIAPAGEPLRILHLGGGGLTLPRYVAATRPGSVQRVVERDAALTALVRRVLPLPRGADIRVRAADARDVVEGSRPARYDMVVADVYGGARVPARVMSIEFATAVARVLRPDGCYAVNLADGPWSLTFTRGQVATLSGVFAEVCLMADTGVLRGRRFGNLVLAAGAKLPVPALARKVAGDAFPVRLVHGADLAKFAGGARPVTDAKATDSPAPPSALFG